jgi:hypothetical protein
MNMRLDDIEDVIPNDASILNKLATAEDVEEAMANAGLKVVATMPPSPADQDVVLYVGSSGEYTKGGIYQYDASNSEWVLISTADVDLSCYQTSWTGTRAEWEALPADDKLKYEIVNLTDDVAGSSVTNAVTNNDMRAVTSNAVYTVINNLESSTVGTLTFMKTGKVVTVYGAVSNLPTTSDTNVYGTIPTGFRPSNTYAIMDFRSATKPYNCIGSVWAGTQGGITIYKENASVTTGYVYGTYVTA